MPRSLPALLTDDFPLPLDRPFTFRQAIEAGLTRRRLGTLLREQLLRRMIAGVYVAAQAKDDQLLRARALRLVVPDRYVVTDESAGWLAGASMILRPGAHLETPPITVFGADGESRLRNGISDSGRRRLTPADVVVAHGVRMTTPLRTAADLGRLRHRDRAIAALDQLLGLDVFDREELLESVERFKGFRGVRQLRALAPIADSRSESPGESALRLRFHDAALPTPTPQFEVFADGRFLARADLALEELRFIAEYDGEQWHGPERARHDEQRRERLREAGWVVCVLTRNEVFGRKQNAIEELQAGVREARARMSRPF